MSNYHLGVLKKEVEIYLNVRSQEKYVDCTIGGGDHTEQILKRGGLVFGIDRDIEAIDYCLHRFKEHVEKERLVLAHANFSNIYRIALEKGFEKVSGIIYDLGVSSFQLNTMRRGFSFKDPQAPLDMRMGNVEKVSAADLLNTLSLDQIKKVFITYGQVEKAQILAEKIVEARRKIKICKVKDLLSIVDLVYKGRGKTHPATKVFLALRIAVNLELAHLKESLPRAVSLLKESGRIVVISFHSLEDRQVKLFGRSQNNLRPVSKIILPGKEEILSNPRSRSAKMRVYSKIKR